MCQHWEMTDRYTDRYTNISNSRVDQRSMRMTTDNDNYRNTDPTINWEDIFCISVKAIRLNTNTAFTYN